ncbi:MAG: flagellar hook capping protein [Candidatus Omnitrophica bacterium]|nr:flagellar hook capping protein [Candidatus Omnitrophota bacterium]
MLVNSVNSAPINFAFRAEGKEALGKEDFLQLLILQLKMQNPLEPVKNEDFIAQLAQFNSLEELINLNRTMESLSSLQLLSYSSNLLGRDVEALRDDGLIMGKVKEVRVSNGEIILLIEADKKSLEVALNSIVKVR